jgi:BlaI family penicillinase repressor
VGPQKRGFIKDIQEQFPDPQPPYNTISTIVRVLVKKEIVSYKSYGGSYQYYPHDYKGRIQK